MGGLLVRGIYVLRNSMFYAILAAVMSVTLGFACLQAPVFAEEEAPDVVTDWAGLSEWLDNHRDVGGTVVFGADIEADEIEFNNSDFSQPVTIDTGAYGLTATASSLITNYYGGNPNAHITIVGEGVDKPVLSYIGDDDYRFGLYFFTIIAYGRDGQGGTAFRLNCGIRGDSIGRSSGIYAYGADAVGIDCGGDADLSWLTVESDGIAIQAAGSISLFACHIKGGLSGSEVTLDTCETPDIPGATVIHRKVSSITSGYYLILGKPYAYQVAGRPVNEDWFFESPYIRDNIVYAVVMSADGVPDKYTAVYVTYDRADIDIQTIGAKTVLTARFFETFEGMDILPDDITFDLTIETVDGRIPHFTGAQSGWMFYDFYYFFTGESLAPLTLWRSDDNGESWYMFWREDEPELTGATVYCYDDRLTVQLPRMDFEAEEYLNQEPFLLAFETEGMTGGQVVFFDPSTGELNPNMGGDRDGGDRMILPWEVFASGDVGDTSGAGNTSGANGNDGADYQQWFQFPDNKGNTGSGNLVDDSSQSSNSDIVQAPPVPKSDPQDKSADPNNPAASDMQNISDSNDSDASDVAVTEVSEKEVQEDIPPLGSLPVIQHGDNLILEQDAANGSTTVANQQPLASNAVNETRTFSEFTDNPGRSEAGVQQETKEKAPFIMMDTQLFQAEQPDDLSFVSDKNGFPVLPVIAGLAFVGGAGSVVYIFGKRRLYHK